MLGVQVVSQLGLRIISDFAFLALPLVGVVMGCLVDSNELVNVGYKPLSLEGLLLKVSAGLAQNTSSHLMGPPTQWLIVPNLLLSTPINAGDITGLRHIAISPSGLSTCGFLTMGVTIFYYADFCGLLRRSFQGSLLVLVLDLVASVGGASFCSSRRLCSVLAYLAFMLWYISHLMSFL